MDKRRKLMKDYEDLRKRKQDEYEAQRRRRIELRNSKTRRVAKVMVKDQIFHCYLIARRGYGRD